MLGETARRELLARIEWVATRPECWTDVVDWLVRATGSNIGQIVEIDLADPRRNRMLLHPDHVAVRRYNKHFCKLDPLNQVAGLVRDGQVFSSRTYFLDPANRCSEFFTQWCEPYGIGDTMFMALGRKEGRVQILELARPWSMPLFDDRPARRLVESLYGPLSWAAEKARFRAAETACRHEALEALGRDGIGCLLVEPGFKVADSNRVVRDMLGDEDGWSLEGERLHLPTDVQQALDHASFDPAHEAETIELHRPSGLRPYQLRFCPGNFVAEGANWRLRALLVIDPERSGVDRRH